MFGFRGIGFVQQTLKQINFSNFKSLTHMPKNNISITAIGLQTLINPNVMKLVNLRELILKSKSEVETVTESLQSIVNLAALNHIISNTSLNKMDVGNDALFFMPIISLDSDRVGAIQPSIN